MDLSLLGMLSAAGGGSSSSKKAEGNPVQLDGLQGGVPFNEMVVSGKNLIPSDYMTKSGTYNGVTVTVKNDGRFDLSGTATSEGYILTILMNYPLIGGKKYTFNCNKQYDVNTFNLGLIIRDKSGNWKSGLDSFPKTITADDGDYISSWRLWTYNGVEYSAENIEIQLELGDTATEYEPPITGREMTVGVSGKNLLRYPFANTTKTENGITFTDNGDGSITVNGTATATVYFSLSSNKALPTGKYVLSKSMDNILIYVDKYLDNAFYQRVATSTVTVKELIFIVSEEDAKKYTYKFGIQFNKGNIADNVTIYPQLELGDTATDYEPYHGAEYTITPDSNPYTVPVDITQYDGINVLSIADDSNPIISVSGNKASEQLSTIYRTLDNKPVRLFDGNIPTSSLDGYAEFTVDKEYTALMVVPTCNTSRTYILGVCTVIPMSYIESTEKDFSVTGSPRGTDTSSRAYIKRDGNTIYVRETSTTCDYMTIYGI